MAEVKIFLQVMRGGDGKYLTYIEAWHVTTL